MENKTESENRMLVVNNFFDKIKKFFYNLFRKRTIQSNNRNEELPRSNRNKFLEEISTREDPRLLDIQSKIEDNEIIASNHCQEDIKEINKLYEKQIDILNENLKRKTIELKLLKKNNNG